MPVFITLILPVEGMSHDSIKLQLNAENNKYLVLNFATMLD